MSDRELSAEVRAKAQDLCDALEAASQAGLLVKIEFKTHFAEFLGQKAIRHGDWKFSADIKRVEHF